MRRQRIEDHSAGVSKDTGAGDRMEIMEYTDTIAAIATAMGNSGIGIVRISGENAVEVAEKVFRTPGKKKLSESESHTIHYGYVYDGDEAWMRFF